MKSTSFSTAIHMLPGSFSISLDGLEGVLGLGVGKMDLGELSFRGQAASTRI